MSSTILLKCPACPAQKDVARIPDDPPEAVVVVVHCDRHASAPDDAAPKYLDANGGHITLAPEISQ